MLLKVSLFIKKSDALRSALSLWSGAEHLTGELVFQAAECGLSVHTTGFGAALGGLTLCLLPLLASFVIPGPLSCSDILSLVFSSY